MKKRRHAKILELINSHDIETQEELQTLPLNNGYEVTQATISRDIKELRLVKDLSEKGRYVALLRVKRIITKTQGEQAEYLANQS